MSITSSIMLTRDLGTLLTVLYFSAVQTVQCFVTPKQKFGHMWLKPWNP